MTNYRVGARLERLAKVQLERAGYFVMRSAGSHGALDLIAVCEDGILLIQVKGRGACRPADLEKLRTVPKPLGARRQLWERRVEGKQDWVIREV